MVIHMNNKEKIDEIKNKLGNSSDIVVRELSKDISYIYLESVSSDDKISNFLLKSIVNIKNIDNIFEYLTDNIFNSHVEVIEVFDECYYYLSSGYTCLFLNNEVKYLAIESKASLDRGVSESNSEPLIRGPKDSFTENNATNIGLIRKRIKDTNLRFDEHRVGRRTQSKVSIIYISDVAKKKNIEKIKKKISKIDIDGILDSGYIRDFIESGNQSIFPKVISTERADFACQELLQGKIVIMVENSPYVLILPAILNDFIKTSEDYYHSSISSSFTRILRCIAFFITIITPALYIAFMTYNQDMIPNQLLISLASQRSQVPFPTFIEVLIFLIIFEILREADLKAPSASGASMSIVGALILGEAAVSAGIVSPIVIIVVAITSICELAFTDMDFINAIRQWRLIFIFSTLFTGFIGIVSIGIILIIKLSSMELIDTPYLIPFSPLKWDYVKDNILLSSTNKRKKRPSYLTTNKMKG
jgi:Bacillus/Clostridium GerA spore germination protein.